MDFNTFVDYHNMIREMDEIYELIKLNKTLRDQLAQLKYHNSDKGKAKMHRNNERRRNKTLCNNVVRGLNKSNHL